MKILISNDDGISAKGIKALAEILEPFGQLRIVAPKRHQSAMSMSVSLGLKKLVFKEVPGMGPGNWAYLDATPASCVKFGLENYYEHRNPDIVVSGINHGSNASMAANYSATLGAADEGALNGCKAIGVSLCDFGKDPDFSAVKAFLPGIFQDLVENWPEDCYGLVYNINFPSLPVHSIKGIRIARQGRGHWEKEFRPWDEEMIRKYAPLMNFETDGADVELEAGETAFTMVGDFIDDEPYTGDADHRLNDEGWITITPNTIDRTMVREVTRLKNKGLEKEF